MNVNGLSLSRKLMHAVTSVVKHVHRKCDRCSTSAGSAMSQFVSSEIALIFMEATAVKLSEYSGDHIGSRLLFPVFRDGKPTPTPLDSRVLHQN